MFLCNFLILKYCHDKPYTNFIFWPLNCFVEVVLMSLEKSFNKNDVIKSYQWLGHQDYGYTELLAIHPSYKPGRENYDHNMENKAFPKIWYVKTEKQLLAFLYRYHKDHICCYGVNPRASILKNSKGFPRRSKDSDIEIFKNFYFDFDLTDNSNRKKKLKLLDEFLAEVDNHLSEIGIQKPVRAFTGNGYHLLFAVPDVHVQEHSDIGNRLNSFLDEIYNKYNNDMNSYGIRLDKTIDLSRVAKIYGSRKPGMKQNSKFYGNERFEDNVLLEHLLSLPLSDNPQKSGFGNRVLTISTYDSLPSVFLELLEKDGKLANLWNGTNKESGDTTKSGYDMSLLLTCIKHGITDVKALATILAKRADGSFIGSAKDDNYIRLTITKALQTSSW